MEMSGLGWEGMLSERERKRKRERERMRMKMRMRMRYTVPVSEETQRSFESKENDRQPTSAWWAPLRKLFEKEIKRNKIKE